MKIIKAIYLLAKESIQKRLENRRYWKGNRKKIKDTPRNTKII